MRTRLTIALLYATLSALVDHSLAAAQSYMPGHLDPEFHAYVSGSVLAITVDEQHRILIGGNFTSVNGSACTNLARLTPEGFLDSSFAASVGSVVRRIRVLADGSILVAGDFQEINATARPGIARLQVSGAVDSSFDTSQLGAMWVPDFQPLPDGGVITAHPIRLLPDGRFDTNFPGVGHTGLPASIELLPDGRMMLTGWQSVFWMEDSRSVNVARVMADGKVDPGFQVDMQSYSSIGGVSALRVLPGGDYLIGGDFRLVNGTPSYAMARLNPDGSLDPEFVASIGSQKVEAFELQSDGRIVVGGWINPAHVYRMSPAGALDQAFSNRRGANSGVYSIAIQGDGRILVGGDFSTFDGKSTGNLVRLRGGDATAVLPEFTLEPNSRTILEARTLTLTAEADAWPAPHFQWQFDGKVIVGATSNVLVLPDCNLTQSGGYSVVASNAVGAITSRVAQVTIQPSPTRPGAVDVHDDPSEIVSDYIYAFLHQPDGKLLTAGKGSIRRLTRERVLDATFGPALLKPSTGWVNVLQALGGGGFVAGGSFTNINNTSALNVARFDRDGHINVAFNPQPNGEVVCAALDNDGRILLGGAFTGVQGNPTWRLVRLGIDGSLDPSFMIAGGISGSTVVQQVVVAPSGKIVIGGTFSRVGSALRSGLARLEANGSVDAGFDPLEGTSSVSGLSVLGDGSLVVAGNLRVRGQTKWFNLCRLTAEGQLDNTFKPLLQQIPYPIRSALLLLPDGRLLANYPAGPGSGWLTMFLPNGELDTAFQSEVNRVDAITQDLDGSYLISGPFEGISGVPRKHFARLHGDPDRHLPIPQLGAATLNFPVPTVSGRRYALEEKADMNISGWTVLMEFDGDGNTNEIAVPANTAARRFFRMRVGW